jgi:2-succinyl-6-hydroxy-2,4-cyclohexadiene-1-carboxylate synthase
MPSRRASIDTVQLLEFPTPAGTLSFRTWSGSGRAVTCFHGFTLHGGMFAALASHGSFSIIAPDLPGHGGTQISPVDLETTLDSLATWMRATGPPHLVLGYSQGGRLARHLAAHHPDVVDRLILVSTSSGLSPAKRASRRAADRALADRIERNGLSAFLDEWLVHPLVGTHLLDAGLAAADRRLREENTAEGLAAALRGLGQGEMPELGQASIAAPTVWVAGARDTRYAAAARNMSAAGYGEARIVADVGHNVVLEAPSALGSIISEVARRSA